MVFPSNNLPSDAKYWVREVEKKIVNLENNLSSSDINNTTRDSQLQVTASQALIAAQAADAAATEAQNAVTALEGLGTDGSIYGIHGGNIIADTITANEIDANYVYAGVIDADQINAGTLTGFTVKTAASGQRVEMSGSDVRFYNSSTQTGNIVGSNYSGANSLTINNPNGVVLIDSSGGTYVDGGLVVSNGTSILTGISNSGTITSTGSITTPAGTVSGSIVTAGNFSGTKNTSIASNTQSTFAGNLFINSSGIMFRDPTISSQEAKENVEPYEFDTDAFISVNPVTFNYKDGVFSNPGESDIKQLGFILEDFENAGLGEHLVIPKNEIDQYKGLRYDKLYMFLHKVVQEQDKTIKDLTARIEALETN